MTEQVARQLKNGDKLKLTKEALAQRLDEPRGATTAIFQRWSRDKKLLCVQRDGYSSAHDLYHWKFWEKI